MKVGVVFANQGRHALLQVAVDDGATARQAIEASGILQRFPEINLEQNKIGIFGKTITLDTVLEDGARVEIYRPITADPKKVPKRAKPAKPAAKDTEAA